jgi:hypothetical protein
LGAVDFSLVFASPSVLENKPTKKIGMTVKYDLFIPVLGVSHPSAAR